MFPQIGGITLNLFFQAENWNVMQLKTMCCFFFCSVWISIMAGQGSGMACYLEWLYFNLPAQYFKQLCLIPHHMLSLLFTITMIFLQIWIILWLICRYCSENLKFFAKSSNTDVLVWWQGCISSDGHTFNFLLYIKMPENSPIYTYTVNKSLQPC